MKVDLNKQVVNLIGQPLDMSFPDREIVEKLPKDDKGAPDKTKLPRETIKNMLVNCLAGYHVEDKKEVFKVYDMGVKIMNAKDEFEITEDEQSFLRKVIENSIYKEVQNGNNIIPMGIYKPFGIAQLLKAIGIDN